MTRVNNVEETTECETGYIPSELPVDPDDSLQIAKQEWPPDDILVMPELIIPPDSEPAIAKVCRLCNVENTTWFPFYNSDNSLALEEKHLEIIRILASINITPKYDHASVVCAHCLMRIEEIACFRGIWQRNDEIRLAKDPTRMPSVEPPDQSITEDPEAVGKGAESDENKFEQTSGHENIRWENDPTRLPSVEPTDQSTTEDPEAISNGAESEENQSEQTLGDESIIIDDESDDSDVEIVSISEPSAKRYRTRSEAVKSELIDEALSIISQQFDDTN